MVISSNIELTLGNYNATLTAHPDSTGALANRCAWHPNVGNYERAIAASIEAIRLSGSLDAYHNRGNMEAALHNYEHILS